MRNSSAGLDHPEVKEWKESSFACMCEIFLALAQKLFSVSVTCSQHEVNTHWIFKYREMTEGPEQ